MSKKINYSELIKETLILTVAVAVIAAAVFFFLVPSHASVSSISGLGIVLSNFIPMPLSAITMILNVLLLIIGFFTCGKEFGIKTVYTSIKYLNDRQPGVRCALLYFSREHRSQHFIQPKCLLRRIRHCRKNHEQIPAYGTWKSNVTFRNVRCAFCCLSL